MTRRTAWLAPLVILALAGCNRTSTESTTKTTNGAPPEQAAAPATEAPPAAASANEITTPSGLRYTDNVVGQGAEARSGSMVTVHYTGTLTDGTQFDSSVGRQPLSFTIDGSNPFDVIQGWDEGVKGMKVGGKRHLVIPGALGYGEQGYPGTIPPNATLIFDIELLEVK